MSQEERLVLQENVTKSCRICLENDNVADLITPCLCKGGSEYVHRTCLDNWRALNQYGKAFKFCDVCQFEYVIEPVVDDPIADRKRLLKFRLLVTRDMGLIILLVQLIIIGLTFLVQAADSTSLNIKNLFPNSMSSFGIYYLSSLILFLAFLGLFGMIGFCCGWMNDSYYERRHYHEPCPVCFCYPYNSRCFDCSGCDGCGDCGGCGDCDCHTSSGGSSGSSGDGGGDAMIIIVVILLILAAIGIVVGMILTVIIFNKVAKRHANKLWLQQETKKYVVKDFQGRLHELTPASAPYCISGIQTQ